MAYGKKYISRFKNRMQRDIFRIEIWQRDFAEDETDITSGEEGVFIANFPTGDTEILEPIKSVEFTFSILTDGSIGIEDFYADDDEQFRVDFYFESDEFGGGTEKILYTGFLIQDGASEALTDIKHNLIFKATDNLALLKNKTWDQTSNSVDLPIALGGYVNECLQETGLYSHDTTIDKSLPLIIYNNLFENTTDDRSLNPINDPFNQTILYPNMFKRSDGTWQDLYSILTQVLSTMNADIIMCDGVWNVRRIPEYRLFTDGEIPGTGYIYNGSGTDIAAVTLEPLVEVDRGGTIQPVREDQIKAMQRPFKYVQSKFDYNQPSYIIQRDLQIPSDAVPYDTETIGDLRYDRYALSTYFPDWVQRGGDSSYLEIVTNILADPEQEEDRYIVTPSPDDNQRGVQFNPITVTAGDKLSFSLRYKTLTDTDQTYSFWIRFTLITTTGEYVYILNFPVVTVPETSLIWTDPDPANEWDQSNGCFKWITDSEANDIDTTEYLDWDLEGLMRQGVPVPPVPYDGILLIQIDGTNTTASGFTDNQTTAWKDIELKIESFISSSVQITGQSHKDELDNTSKVIQENELTIDDSPRNSIAGTLFTDALTDFEYTDIDTGEVTNIGNVYFTRTTLWHRAALGEALRLGNITTQERLGLQLTSRLIIEGTFKILRYDIDKFISPLTLFTFGFITGKYFIAASMEIDYMECTFKARLVEIYSNTDLISQTVFLYGSKETQTGLANGTIQFDTIGYFNNADTFLTPSLSNSRFTYTGFDTTLNISIIFYVPISGSGTATFDLLKNGSIIDTITVNAVEVFKVIDFHIDNEPVTTGDYFEVDVDTGGASVDIQSGSINLTVNGVIAMNDSYTFNYIYQIQ